MLSRFPDKARARARALNAAACLFVGSRTEGEGEGRGILNKQSANDVLYNTPGAYFMRSITPRASDDNDNNNNNNGRIIYIYIYIYIYICIYMYMYTGDIFAGRSFALQADILLLCLYYSRLSSIRRVRSAESSYAINFHGFIIAARVSRC